MALVRVSDKLETPSIEADLDGSTAIAKDSLLYRDTTNGVVKSATTSAGKTIDIIGVAGEAVASGGTSVDVVPVVGGPLQEWEVDCTSNTASAQLWKAHAMTSATEVKNTSTHVGTNLGVFIATKIVGAAADKKLRGYFVSAHQVS